VLDRLGAAAPPDDVVLDRGELLEGAIDVEGIELVGRNAVCEQRIFERAAVFRILIQIGRASCRERV